MENAKTPLDIGVDELSLLCSVSRYDKRESTPMTLKKKGDDIMENIILVVLLVILLVTLVITAEKPLVLSEKDWWRKARKPEPRCRSPPIAW